MLPVALATLGHPAQEVQAAVRAQGHVTHNNVLSDAACDCIVAGVQLALQGGDRRAILSGPAADLVHAFPQFAYDAANHDSPGADVVDTLQVVLNVFSLSDGFGTRLIDVVNRDGDADTAGAIAGMLAGALHGARAIPRCWLAALDPEVARACRRQARERIRLADATR